MWSRTAVLQKVHLERGQKRVLTLTIEYVFDFKNSELAYYHSDNRERNTTLR
jgi:hypothetical protein